MNIIDIIVPDLPESVINATVICWHKKIGDIVNRDQILVEIETDKIVLEIPAPESGTIKDLLVKEGSIVVSKQILGRLCLDKNIDINITNTVNMNKDDEYDKNDITLSPSNRRFISKYDLNVKDIKGIDINGNILTKNNNKCRSLDQKNNLFDYNSIEHMSSKYRNKKRLPMNNLRKRISERLLESKNKTVMLTTFNEVNMKPVINLRKKYCEIFEKRYNIRLGFMSFYVKAVLEALKKFPCINASIDLDEIIYYDYFDISIAISTSRGLLTPVLKNVDKMTIPDIEKNIKNFVLKAQNNKLKVEDLIGGNFTITNGGIFGSLMSTPIINPPQSAILGMHTIKDRPMVKDNKIIILPMMYLALTYDHRLIDGKESVGFLSEIKDIIENPIYLLFNK
ncbi:MAG: dihydrolipoyllysine-residue succinyltransferase [gamma proteobacterium endosymbiont of Trioza apicalis]